MRSAITVTEVAKNKLIALCDLHGRDTIKLRVRARGCAGHSYHMDFADTVDRFDEVVPLDATRRLAVEATSLMLVLGTEIDWVERGIESRFAFNNPLQKGSCGCGASFFLVETAVKNQC
jgi:iron-sulfur cluster assembly protein